MKFQADCQAIRGMVATRAEYRVKCRDGVTPEKCVEEARSDVRRLRKNSGRLGIDPDKLITSGSSGGVHLAACMMIAQGVEAGGDDLSISTILQAMVLFNPALSFENEQIIQRLGDNKASVNAKYNRDCTSLNMALLGGYLEVAELLINRGAGINNMNIVGLTVLNLTSGDGRKDIVEFLIAKGADVNVTDNHGRALLWYAQERVHIEIVVLLGRHGAKE